MKVENFARAQEIHKVAKYLMEKITKLTAIIEESDKISRLTIGTPYINQKGDISFHLASGAGEGNLFNDQPERVQILTRAFVACLLDAYRDELNKLTAEFDNL